jgi:hypothetical protein
MLEICIWYFEVRKVLIQIYQIVFHIYEIWGLYDSENIVSGLQVMNGMTQL